MAITQTTKVERIQEAETELREEHAAIQILLHRLEQATDVGVVADLLRQLVPKLKEHFAREEHPGGLYDRMGATTHALAGDLWKLVDDHYRILSSIRSVQASSSPDDREQTMAFAQQLVGWLRDHERREHELVRRTIDAT